MDPELPEIIKEVGFDFDWDVTKVWKLQYPSEEVSISMLEWHFTIPFWNTSKGFYDLTPDEVMCHPEHFKEEYDRTMNADLSHPIDLMEHKGRWLILDGLHRLVKAKILGQSKVMVRKIPRSEVSNISPDDTAL